MRYIDWYSGADRLGDYWSMPTFAPPGRWSPFVADCYSPQFLIDDHMDIQHFYILAGPMWRRTPHIILRVADMVTTPDRYSYWRRPSYSSPYDLIERSPS